MNSVNYKFLILFSYCLRNSESLCVRNFSYIIRGTVFNGCKRILFDFPKETNCNELTPKFWEENRETGSKLKIGFIEYMSTKKSSSKKTFFLGDGKKWTKNSMRCIKRRYKKADSSQGRKQRSKKKNSTIVEDLVKNDKIFEHLKQLTGMEYR